MEALESNSIAKEQLYMNIAKLVATKSKDPNTKVGAVIINDDRILSIGYNGAPRGFPDNELPTGHSVNLIEDKNTYMVHAELNAILNYSGHMTDFKGATIYCTFSPCTECTKALIQVGIKRIIYLYEYKEETLKASKLLCDIAEVNIEKFKEGEKI